LDELKGLSDKKKVEKINSLIQKQIKRDDGVGSMPYAVFYTTGGSGNCMVFSSKFLYLCDKVGIPCLILQGKRAGEPNHMWNTVYVEGKWWGYDAATTNGKLRNTLNSGGSKVYAPLDIDIIKFCQELMVPGSTIGIDYTSQPSQSDTLSYTDETDFVEIPNLIGLTETEAATTIQNLGLYVNISRKTNYSIENGLVYDMSFTGPSVEQKNGKFYADTSRNTVNIYVAKNNNSEASNNSEQTQTQTPTEQTQPPNTAPVLTLEEQGYVAVPNVIGLSEAEAVATFKTLGFTVQTVNTADSQNLSGYVSGVKIDGKTEISNGKTYAKPDECIIRIAIPVPK
jgi:hypothetical protein